MIMPAISISGFQPNPARPLVEAARIVSPEAPNKKGGPVKYRTARDEEESAREEP